MNSYLFKILNNIPAISEADEDDLKDASKKAVLVGYPENCHIYNIGDESKHFYIIKSGMIEMFTKDNDGNLMQTQKHYPDNFFGEMALFDKNPRKHIAKCIENSEIYVFNIYDFKDLLYL